MRPRRCATTILGCMLLMSSPLASRAADDSDLVQTTARGRINWSMRVVSVTGSGPPSSKAPNVAVARLGAERAAKADAVRNLLEALRGLQVTGASTPATLLEKIPDLKGRLEAVARGFKALDTRYYADGGVDLVVELPLDGPLAEALMGTAGAASEAAASAGAGPSAQENTGVVVNAKGLKALPALAPRLLDEAGSEVYGPARVAKDMLRQYGTAGYSRSMDAALKDNRVADKPLIVRATRVADGASTDLVLQAADAAKVAAMANLLAQGRVIIVLD
jgi:hypothetical protein